MRLFEKLFHLLTRSRPAAKSVDDGIESVFVTVPASEGADAALTRESPSIKQLQEVLRDVLGSRGTAQVGAEFGEITVSLRGPDADALWEVCAPVLRRSSLTPRGFVLRSYGARRVRQAQTTF